MIFTFYSYKGGVGRSMALANVAAWLFERGLRVAMIDWDLEAPGLESFFFEDDAAREQIRGTVGLIDLLTSFKRKFTNLELGVKHAEGSARADAVADALSQVLAPLSHSFYPIRTSEGGGSISLLPSGWRSGDRFSSYAEAVQRFDWSEFYTHYEGEGFFEWMRRELSSRDLADAVLIDSRTGVSEMGGVCTRQLPDVVVCLCAPNAQNLDGVERMASSFNHHDVVARRGRRVETVMIPSRVDLDNTELKRTLQAWFHERFSAYTPDKFKSLTSDFWRLRIPYFSNYAYRERLAVGDPKADQDLVGAYRQIAVHLAVLSANESPLYRALLPDIEAVFGRVLPDVALLCRFEDRAQAAAVHERAAQTALRLLPPPPGGTELDWEAAARAQLEQSKVALLLASPEAIRSGWLKRTWRAARELGVRTFLVEHGQLEDALAAQPGWMRSALEPESDALWARIALALRDSIRPDRAPFMAPPLPAGHAPRHDAVELLARALRRATALDEGRASVGSANRAVLCAAAGAGKSVVAAEFCRDEATGDEFIDGVVWVTLGPDPDLPAIVGKMLSAFSGQARPPTDPSEAFAALERKLASKRCLIVLDDVWKEEHVQRLLSSGGPACAWIITTRNRGLAIAIDGTAVGLERDEAVNAELLMRNLQVTPAQRALLPAWAEALVGGSALGMVVLNQALRKRTAQQEELEHALDALTKSAERAGAKALDQAGASDSSGSIQAAFEPVFAKLSAERLRRLTSIARRKESLVTFGALANAWKIPSHDAEDEVRRLADLSLLEVVGGFAVRLPPLVRLALRARTPDSAPASTPPARARGAGPKLAAAAALALLALVAAGVQKGSEANLPVDAPHDAGVASVDASMLPTSPSPESIRALIDGFRASGGELMASGSAEGAIKAYTSAIELNAEDATLYLARGAAFRAVDDVGSALNDYDKAIKLAPDSVDAFVARATTKLLQNKDDNGAVQDLQTATKLNPRNADAQLSLGKAFADRGQTADALKAYSAAIEAAPSRADGYFLRGSLYADLKMRQQAIRDLEQVLNSREADATTAKAATARMKQLGAGTQTPPRQPLQKNVYIHYRATQDEALIGRLRDELRRSGLLVGKPQLVSWATTAGDIRYAFPDDRIAAESIADQVQATLANQGVRLKLNIIKLASGRFPNAVPGNIEVWLPTMSEMQQRPPDQGDVSHDCRARAELVATGKGFRDSKEWAIRICSFPAYIVTPLPGNPSASQAVDDYKYFKIEFEGEDNQVTCRCRDADP